MKQPTIGVIIGIVFMISSGFCLYASHFAPVKENREKAFLLFIIFLGFSTCLYVLDKIHDEIKKIKK